MQRTAMQACRHTVMGLHSSSHAAVIACNLPPCGAAQPEACGGPHLGPAEKVAIVDVVRLVLGVGVRGEPDLAARHHVHIDAIRQHLIRLRRPGVPACTVRPLCR